MREAGVDLTPTTRFLIKVIAGPNTGAEIALDLDRKYLVGTDTALCDIILNDLSVSREHARLDLSEDGRVEIEDLESRNGVVVNRERITTKTPLIANSVVALGTSVFLLIDKETPSETIAAPIFEAPSPEEEEREEEAPPEEIMPPGKKKKPKKPPLPLGTLVLALVVAGLAVLFGVGAVSLFKSEEVEFEKTDYLKELEAVTNEFPGVRFTYNQSSEKLFLMGHVRTGIEHGELTYKLHGLPFLRSIEDNVVNDEAVWQEMNILLSKHENFKGASMHSPEPGQFVLTGYLKTEKQAADLIDYMNVNFNYLSRLQNLVVVDQQVVDEVESSLLQKGFGAVTATFNNGELQLMGYLASNQTDTFDAAVQHFKEIPGVRLVRNYVVLVTPEQGVIDLNRRYPGRYKVTGYSKHGDVSVNVVVNGKIVTRGDKLDGMTVTSIQPNVIFLEKDGLKYKIDYTG